MSDEKEVIPPPAAPEWKNVSTVNDTDLDEVVSDMPKAIPDAINAAQDKENASAALVTDPKGRVFDPAIHAADASGKPILTPTGRFKMKMRLPKQGAALNMPSETPLVNEYDTVARTMVGLFIQTGYAFVGDEWLPEKSKDIDEESNLVNATKAYCENTGFKDLPAGVVVAVAFLGYGLRRINRPRTKSLVEKTIAWGQAFVSNIWLRFTGKQIRVVPVDNKEMKK